MDASYAIARNIANIRFEDIPDSVVKIAKRDVLDTLGTTLAATTLGTGCKEVVDLVKEGAGKRESTIVGFGGRVPSWMAALANGTLAYALDYDDAHPTGQIHSGATNVSAAFAVAERVGNVNGKAFLTALVVGIDLGARMSVASFPRARGFHPTTLYGFFGATATASRIMGLGEEKVQHALGIAYSQASGQMQGHSEAAATKKVQAGFAAKGGVLAALMAQKGVTGALNSLEGEYGFYNVYHAGRKYDSAGLVADLGKRFEVSNLCFKPYPSGRGTHASIDSTLEIMREHNLRAKDIESITVYKSPIAVKIEGGEDKRKPKNALDAQLNIIYTVATAAVKERVGLQDFTPEAIKDPDVLKMAQKVYVKEFPEFGPNNFHPGITEVKTKAGDTYSKRVEEPSGGPENPMSTEQFINKFTECASYSVKPLTRIKLKKVIDMAMNLEQVEDVGAVIRLLA